MKEECEQIYSGICKLRDSLVKAIQVEPERTIVPGQKELSKYLITNKYSIPDLPLQVLQKCSIPLIDTLMIPRFAYVSRDHAEYWAWTAQMVNACLQSGELFEAGAASQFGSLVHLILISGETTSLRNFRHAFGITASSYTLSAYVAFPLLERIVRMKCPKHLTREGFPIKPFKGKCSPRNYKSATKRHVSNLCDELYLLEDEAEPQLCSALKELSSKGLYEMLWSWRNETLHGEEFWQLRSGVVTHVICLILWHEITEKVYSQHSGTFKQALQRRHFAGTPWEWYDPNWFLHNPRLNNIC